MLDVQGSAIAESETVPTKADVAGQGALTMEQIDALLTLLSTDDSFRALFQSDLSAAFQKLPGQPEAPKVAIPGACFWPRELASKEALAASRQQRLDTWLSFGTLIPKILEV